MKAWLDRLRSYKENGGDNNHYQGNGSASDDNEQGKESGDSSVIEIVRRLMDMNDDRVDGLMVPRADMVAADISTDPRHIMKRMREHKVDIIPLYRHSLDQIIGCVRAWDLALLDKGKKTESLSTCLEKPLYVVGSARVLDVFADMCHHGTTAAVVLDEYGGVDGFITMHDVMMSVSQDISHMRVHGRGHGRVYGRVHGLGNHTGSWLKEREGSYIVDARCHLHEIEKAVGPLRVSGTLTDDCDTVGGLVFALAGRVPDRGEVVRSDAGWEFDVLDVDMRRIRRLRLRAVPAEVPHDTHPRG